MSEPVLKYMLSREFNWLPSEIDEQDANVIDNYVQILSLDIFLKNKKYK